jgi:hypothetical protein
LTKATAAGEEVSPAYLRRACEAGLRRLDTDRRTLVQGRQNVAAAGHGPLPPEGMERVQAILGEPLQV